MLKSDLEKILEEYPTKVGEALKTWRKADLEKDRIWAVSFLKAKALGMSIAEAEATVEAGQEWYEASLRAIQAEGEFKATEETLLAAKKLCDHRTAF